MIIWDRICKRGSGKQKEGIENDLGKKRVQREWWGSSEVLGVRTEMSLREDIEDFSLLAVFINLSKSALYLTKSEGKVALLHPILCDLMDQIVHWIFLGRILEWVAVPFSRGSSWPRNWTEVSCIAGRFFTSSATREFHVTKVCCASTVCCPELKLKDRCAYNIIASSPEA